MRSSYILAWSSHVKVEHEEIQWLTSYSQNFIGYVENSNLAFQFYNQFIFVSLSIRYANYGFQC